MKKLIYIFLLLAFSCKKEPVTPPVQTNIHNIKYDVTSTDPYLDISYLDSTILFYTTTTTNKWSYEFNALQGKTVTCACKTGDSAYVTVNIICDGQIIKSGSGIFFQNITTVVP